MLYENFGTAIVTKISELSNEIHKNKKHQIINFKKQ